MTSQRALWRAHNCIPNVNNRFGANVHKRCYLNRCTMTSSEIRLNLVEQLSLRAFGQIQPSYHKKRQTLRKVSTIFLLLLPVSLSLKFSFYSNSCRITWSNTYRWEMTPKASLHLSICCGDGMDALIHHLWWCFFIISKGPTNVLLSLLLRLHRHNYAIGIWPFLIE